VHSCGGRCAPSAFPRTATDQRKRAAVKTDGMSFLTWCSRVFVAFAAGGSGAARAAGACGARLRPRHLVAGAGDRGGTPAASHPYVAQAGSAATACPDSVQPGWREDAGDREGCPGPVTGSVPPTGMRARPPRPGGEWSSWCPRTVTRARLCCSGGLRSLLGVRRPPEAATGSQPAPCTAMK